MEIQFSPIEEIALIAFAIMFGIAAILIAWDWIDKQIKKRMR